MKNKPFLLRIVLFTALTLTAALHATTGYYRYPALHENILVFTAEGDLWKADLDNLQGHRMTTHPAEESQAAISPDGSMIAFAARYENAPAVYIMPVQGGLAQRVTFENGRIRLQGWTPDGRVMYSTDHVPGPGNSWALKTVHPNTLQMYTFPVADVIQGALDDDCGTLFFIQHGMQATGDNVRVYRGGAMGTLWKYEISSGKEAEWLSKGHEGSISYPMYSKGRIYFLSDKSGCPNIWSVTVEGEDVQQHTHYDDFQVRCPKMYQQVIVYQHGADIKILNISSKESRKLELTIQSDRPHKRERWLDKPLEYLNSALYAGFDDKAVLTARGKSAIASKPPVRLVEIATPEQSRNRNAALGMDGRWVYAINDQTGEHEIWRFAADGSSQSEQLTFDGKPFRWQLSLSPDGKWIAHDDKSGDLWLLDLETGKNQKILSDGRGHSPFSDIVWSHDSELLAVTRSKQGDQRSRIVLYSVAEQKKQVLTSDKYESFSPGFSPDGNWIYFLSSRHFRAVPGSPWGDRNLGPGFDRRTEIYAISLKENAVFPFQQPSEMDDKKTEEADSDAKHKKRAAGVDWNGIETRLWQVPVSASNYRNLTVTDQRLFVLERPSAASRSFDLKVIKTGHQPKIEPFSASVSDYRVSNDGKQLYLRKQQPDAASSMYVVPLADREPSDLSRHQLNAGQWQLAFKPGDEWKQMFHDAWLMHREFLFDKNMRGVDWEKTRQRYLPLLERVSDRYELDDVLAQMMGELSVLHSQVRGGDYPAAQNMPEAASLGALFETSKDGLFIKHIYMTDPELPSQASPLRQPGVNAREGDIITAVNGKTVKSEADVYSLLRNQAGRQVLLDLSRGRETVKTVVTPVSAGSDHQLRYKDWVYRNSNQVVKESEGQIGYLHLYAMGAGDIADFAREFYANFDKHGLIIDVRRNRGGNIDSWIIEKLLRRAWSFWQPTHGAPYTNMQQAFRGHIAVLTDQLTYSDGETFAAGVKSLGLGTLIGMRTAGAGVWLSGRNTLTDRGIARVAETPQFSMDGSYIIEGYGVSPDYEVRNMPAAAFRGEDAQLAFAIAYLKKKLAEDPVPEMKAEKLPAGPASDIK